MNRCPRPLDPIDAEALASGAEPLFAADAASHAALCAECASSVDRAAALTRAIEGLKGLEPPLPDLAERVTRLRSFSARERRTYALWRAPALLSAGLAVAGFALLVGPTLSSGEQAGLGAAALTSAMALIRSLTGWSAEVVRLAPPALDALADTLGRERSVGLASLLLLVPSAFGMTRLLARARSRR